MRRAICTVYFVGDDDSPGQRVAFDAEDDESADEEAREWAANHWPDEEVESVTIDWADE